MARKNKRNADNSTPSPPESAASDAEGRLYTQCPHCTTKYRITVTQLKRGRGLAHCLGCQQDFDALAYLAEKAEGTQALETPAEYLPRLGILEQAVSTKSPEQIAILRSEIPAPSPHPIPIRSTGWILGSIGLFTLLGLQVWLFKGYEIAQNKNLRPKLEKICTIIPCNLPSYRAPAEIKILNHELSKAEEAQVLRLEIIILNEAQLSQSYPKIRVNFQNGVGELVSSGEFSPNQYLEPEKNNYIGSGEMKEIRLRLREPRNYYEGFEIQLY